MRLNILLIIILFLCSSSVGLSQNSKKSSTDGAKEKTVQKMPQFPGGNNAFYAYLDKNVVLPEGFDKKGYLKKHKNKFVPISVSFTVDVDGSITNVRVIDKTHEMLDKKAKEIVKNMPKWEPGTIDGFPIQVEYALPVRFNLM